MTHSVLVTRQGRNASKQARTLPVRGGALLNLIFCAASIPVPLTETFPDAYLAGRHEHMAPPASRRLVHKRTINVQVYARDDDLWDVEAELIDIKARDIEFASGLRRADEPIHHMHLRLTIDSTFHVVDAEAKTYASPYPGYCEDYGAAYRTLIGMNLLRGFSHAVKQHLHGVLGCTHITELTRVLPTAAIQAFAGEVIRPEAGDREQPFQLDRCHALRVDGPAVLRYYPRWWKSHATGAPADEAHAQISSPSTT